MRAETHAKRILLIIILMRGSASLQIISVRALCESICDHSQGLRLARELKDDYSISSMACYLASALLLGGRLPYTLGELKTLRAEADEAYKRANKYISKVVLTMARQQVMNSVRDEVKRLVGVCT